MPVRKDIPLVCQCHAETKCPQAHTMLVTISVRTEEARKGGAPSNCLNGGTKSVPQLYTALRFDRNGLIGRELRALSEPWVP